jgi:hypothetical protein
MSRPGFGVTWPSDQRQGIRLGLVNIDGKHRLSVSLDLARPVAVAKNGNVTSTVS